MNYTGFTKGNVLIPKVDDMISWSVIACDQFTSQPKYWNDVSELIRTKPSTINMIIPEVFLNTDDIDQRIGAVNRAMRTYIRRHVFQEYQDYIYTERTLNTGKIRHGIVGVIDLEKYDYSPNSTSAIRATEGTILERIPPRLKIRENAPLEVSHILVLIDDRENAVISPLASQTDSMQKLYDFELMQGSGSIKGYLVNPNQSESIDNALNSLADPVKFQEKYDISNKGILVYAVGDGNHSLATAKQYYEALKHSMSQEKAENHPARYALAEIVNLNEDCLEFEPINRIVFGVDVQNFMHQLEKEYDVSYNPCDGQYFDCVTNRKSKRVWIKNPSSNVVTGTVQNFIDYYIKNFSGKVDYVHGNHIVTQLSMQSDNIGIIFPAIKKNELFPTVLLDGALPRKTFSMGEAEDKRFYLECRKIK